jgi:hypothetical protein
VTVYSIPKLPSLLEGRGARLASLLVSRRGEGLDGEFCALPPPSPLRLTAAGSKTAYLSPEGERGLEFHVISTCNVGFDLRASFGQHARVGAALSQCRYCSKSEGPTMSAKATKDTIPHRAWVSFVALKRRGARFSLPISRDVSRQFCFTQRARRLSRGRCSHLNASIRFDDDKVYGKSCTLKIFASFA